MKLLITFLFCGIGVVLGVAARRLHDKGKFVYGFILLFLWFGVLIIFNKPQNMEWLLETLKGK